MSTSRLEQRWRGLLEVAAWFLMKALLPSATIVVLLAWLSYRYLTGGFDGVRQYAFAPNGGSGVWLAPVQRSWWSCTCAGVAAVCACLSACVRGLPRCCTELLDERPYPRAVLAHPIASVLRSAPLAPIPACRSA
jgi:hypothetical protein